jgi:hypothetical protein
VVVVMYTWRVGWWCRYGQDGMVPVWEECPRRALVQEKGWIRKKKKGREEKRTEGRGKARQGQASRAFG